GSTRDHLIEVSGFLADGSFVTFTNISKYEFEKKCQLNNLEGTIYKSIKSLLENKDNQDKIKNNYPDRRLKRRNMGYAIDLLLESEVFDENSSEMFNFCKLIAGSEGTLMFITEAKLNLVSLPPSCVGLLCVHLEKLSDAYKANLIALKHQPTSVELMDNTILKLASANVEQQKNRFFVVGDPGAILIVEFVAENYETIQLKAEMLIQELKANALGYAYPVVMGKETSKVWSLRKAGLGVLSNMEGTRKPVAVIEDTAVHPEFLENYMFDMEQLLNKLGLSCVYYAHIGTGEIHLRPVLDLKNKNDKKLFRTVAEETAKLVKKYKGSLSGEHGDGRLRGEFLPFMFGENVYMLLKQLKYTWDKNNIFNPGKIIDAPPMDSSLRFHDNYHYNEIKTYFDYSSDKNFLSAIEKCNGSADCRKSSIIGGTMCPSYMATKDEKNTTRARANMLRELISTRKNPYKSKELYDILDLCLSCKGCKAECPSNIDMAKFKAEFLQHYYQHHRIPIRTLAIANITKLYRLGSYFKPITNFVITNKILNGILKSLLNIAPKRNFPTLSKQSLESWSKKNLKNKQYSEIFIFNDEFTNFLDSELGIYAVLLLEKLGYQVRILPMMESGRTYISKGLIKKAQKIAYKNIDFLAKTIPPNGVIIGIEPAAILSFRDEYIEFANTVRHPFALQLSKQVMTIEEFIYKEYKAGNIKQEQFTNDKQEILVHVHCQYKAIANKQTIIDVLSIPKNYKVTEIPSGCCGMAGSFGFEKEHYDLSMKIGEMILFPAIRNAKKETIIASNGTSCRQQIKDGTGIIALHPIEILYKATNPSVQ
ncbi:MAG: FAD-binding and (Fe-S)-binding domain-containing protein, partial [Bacteroidales bacterium]